MSGFYIALKNLPSWHELSVADNRIEIRVHNLALISIRNNLVASRFSGTPAELQLPPFIEPTQNSWGFGEIITAASKEDGWTTFTCPLPIIFKENESDPDWKKAYAVCATLQVLFNSLIGFEGDTSSSQSQLLGVGYMGLDTEKMGGWGLGVKLSPRLCMWLNKKTGVEEITPIQEVADAMKAAHQQMYRRKGFAIDEYSFMAHIQAPKSLHLACPGDACGLDPEDNRDYDLETGYELVPHNMDGPLQQLTLLAGIAALHDLASKEGA